ncbi:MAG: hypothetical protein DYG89_08650 [Caldilinea sp. CFX5]|nr:hypothetical protein [Caldilinea sp. CFX5]
MKVNGFTYRPIKLWNYVDQIRSGELYIFAPLLPVLTRPMNEALLVEERELILNYEADPVRQRTLLTTAILVAAQSKLFTSDFLWELFKGDPMDLDNPVIAKLFDRAYGQKLAEEIAEVKQALRHEVDVATQRALEAEAAQRKADAAHREAEAEATKQWLEMVFKVLEHRFTSAPIALSMVLQTVPSSQRSAVIDIILEAPTGEACLAAVKQLLQQPTKS